MLGRHIKHCEDSLTAAVFSHLLHLPAELFWQILRNACYGGERLPAYLGEPEVSPWPQWKAEGTSNARYVEPDLFIRFPSLDLIVEAKRWDDRMQTRTQWAAELTAYANEYGGEKRSVCLIALGGLHTEQCDELSCEWTAPAGEIGRHRFVCVVHMCRWQGLLDQCKRRRRELEHMDFATSHTSAEVRILDDLIDLFACHGFSTGRWFSDFEFDRYRLAASLSPHFSRFRAWRKISLK